jgi:predicted Mrr-cat superfamily restriction endonuclease
MTSTLLEDLNEIASQIESIPNTKQYWLVRTQSGDLYQTFKNGNFISIEHGFVQADILNKIRKTTKDYKQASKQIKEMITRDTDLENPGLIAGQVSRFAFDIKIGDIVVIPSYGANEISFGSVESNVIETKFEDRLSVLSEVNASSPKRDYIVAREIKWVKEVPKRDLDPFMYKMLQAHQAISNVSQYGDVIERMVKTFFVREEEASVVLLVDRETDINAQDLFSLGHYLLRSVDEIIKLHNLPLSVHDIDVKLNLNSRGRIQLTSKDMRIIWMVAMLGVLTVEVQMGRGRL